MFGELDSARYFSLTTYRRDGRAVDTPVWFAGKAGTYFVFSAGDAGKVKRLRNSPQARVAACDVRGNQQGDWLPANAHLLSDPQAVADALQSLRRKYGLQMWMADLFSRLSGRFNKRAYIRVDIHDQSK